MAPRPRRGHDPSRQRARLQHAACLLVVAAGAIWAAPSFVSGVSRSAAADLRSNSLSRPSAASPPTSATRLAELGPRTGAGLMAMPLACWGCAALLGAYALRGHHHGASRGVGNHRVVACQASWSRARAQAHEVASLRPQDGMEGASVPAVPAPAERLPVPSSPQVQADAWLPAEFDTVPEAFMPASPRLRAGRALLAGGARRARRHSSPRRAARNSERTARRAVGAWLRPTPTPQQRFVPSYDASRLRTKLQVGLRLLTHIRLERSRETKTPSTSVSCSEQSGLCVARNFNMTRDHHISTIQEASRPCGTCCPVGRQPQDGHGW